VFKSFPIIVGGAVGNHERTGSSNHGYAENNSQLLNFCLLHIPGCTGRRNNGV